MPLKSISEGFTIPEEEHVLPGHTACPGCGAVLTMRFILKALGAKTIMVIPASCSSVIVGILPMNALKIPAVHCAFAAGAATAAGIKAGLNLQGDHETTVLVWAGDGGTFDIGFQGLSASAERNDDILFVCYDNEGYMNTGIQRSSATPPGAWTTTTPLNKPKAEAKKNIVNIMTAHEIPYAATATIAFPADLMRKVDRAKAIRGMKFIHCLAPCPPGWRFDPADTIRLARLAVHSRVFPLFEVYNSREYVLSQLEPVPLEEYLKTQGRFRHLTPEDITFMQKQVDKNWRNLLERAECAQTSKKEES